jgi:hypothetical protein
MEHCLGRDAALDVFKEPRLYGPGSIVGFPAPRSGEGGVVDMSQKRQGLMNNPASMEHGAGVHWLEKAHQAAKKKSEELRKIYNLPERVSAPHNFILVDSSQWS